MPATAVMGMPSGIETIASAIARCRSRRHHRPRRPAFGVRLSHAGAFPSPGTAPPPSASVGAMFFRLTSLELGLILFAVVFGATGVAVALGRRHRDKSEMREPFAVLQGALLGVVGLILAFGLSLAVGRYQDRRTAVVDEANAIGTTYLRAQTLDEPVRSRSLALLVRYADASIRLGNAIPGEIGPSCPRHRVGDPTSAVDAGRHGVEHIAGGQRPAPLRGEPERDDRLAGCPRRGAQQPWCLAPFSRWRWSALPWASPCSRSTSQCSAAAPHRAARRRPCHDVAPRDLRSRPSHARPDHRPEHSARGRARIDEPASGGRPPISP